VRIFVWIGTVPIAFLAGYVPELSQLRHEEAQIADLNFKLKLAQLRTLAGTLYLQTANAIMGRQRKSLVDPVDDPRPNQMLMELSKSQDQITTGLANGDPSVLPKVADLLHNTLSTETL
jgi:hypothetical protein